MDVCIRTTGTDLANLPICILIHQKPLICKQNQPFRASKGSHEGAYPRGGRGGAGNPQPWNIYKPPFNR